MKISDQQINSIVERVVGQMVPEAPNTSPKKIDQKPVAPTIGHTPTGLGCFGDIDSAVNAAEKAFVEYQKVPMEKRKEIITAIRKICNENLEQLARMGRDETGLGRYEDKLAKNLCAINKTPGVEDLETTACTGDQGLTLFERAPFGVIGSITPCTNPSETIISNGIGMIAAGNTVAFNTHPSAKKTSAFTINIMNKAIISAGGPPNLLTTVVSPTIASAQKLMTHPKVRLLAVTGGPAVVGAAMKSGKRVVAAGPGNPPVVVDETADIDKAGRDIVMSASTDNNIICVLEKEIIVTEAAADRLKRALIKHGAVSLGDHQARRLKSVILDDENHTIKEFVGKDIQVILKAIGLDVDSSKRMAFAETGPDHPFATTELLMPVLPFIRVKDIDEAIELAFKLEKGCGHTAVIHSKNIDNMHKMAKRMNTSIFVKNGPALAGLGLGGEGPASFTIASPTGEGVTTPISFTRLLRCVMSGHFGAI